MTKIFTRTEIRAALAKADASTPASLTVKDKAQRAVEILTGCDFIDAEHAVDMAGFGLGAMSADKLTQRALERVADSDA